jgi:hypothetical protein
MTLDRIDPNGNYEPGNCRWATAAQQSVNQRDTRMLLGRPLIDVCREMGINCAIVWERMSKGEKFGEASGMQRASKRGSAIRAHREHSHGYIMVRGSDDQWYYEHRVVMERVLGRALRKGEVVHHINGDRADNRPENLRVFDSHAAHMQRTKKQEPAA